MDSGTLNCAPPAARRQARVHGEWCWENIAPRVRLGYTDAWPPGSDGRRRPSRETVRHLPRVVTRGVDKNTTVVFPAPLMSIIEELGSFLAREKAASAQAAAA
jgi:hypothetical protein